MPAGRVTLTEAPPRPISGRKTGARLFYWAIFLACLWPGAVLVHRTFVSNDLGANPAETLLHETGRAALMLLLAALTVTPVRRLTGWNRVQSVRRMVGLWSFFYATSHLLMYVVFNQLGDVRAIWDDVSTRKFIFAGMFAFVILLALALTSTNGMIRRLGRNWQRLHRLVYVAAISAIVHFAWGQKADIREPLTWAGFLVLLLAVRVLFAVRKRRARLAPAVSR